MAKKRQVLGIESAISVCLFFGLSSPLAAFSQEEQPTTDAAAAASSTAKTESEKPAKKNKKKKSEKAATGQHDTPAEEAVNKANGEEPEIKPEKTTDTAAGGKEEKKEAALDPARPFSPEAIKEYNQGVELQQQGFLNQAIQKYKNALAADDRIERAHCNLGLIYIAQRNFAKASDAFKKALALKANNPFSLNGMGSVYYSKGKLQDAMERWQKAVEVDPNFFSAYFNMANAWKNEKDLDKALQNYVMTIKTNASMADAYYEIGLILAKQKHPAQAQTMLAKAVQLAPEGDFVADAKKQLSGIDSQMGKDENDGEVKMNVVAPPAPPISTDESK
ncbi:MAG: tetratricopeptide repeat protein [Candidatus Obscuribacterales bacterium]|nr:tetratricopeptide repeat protein [Candidatus Obscuribacterales bacterium]